LRYGIDRSAAQQSGSPSHRSHKGLTAARNKCLPLATLALSHPNNDMAAIVAITEGVVHAYTKQALATVEAKQIHHSTSNHHHQALKEFDKGAGL